MSKVTIRTGGVVVGRRNRNFDLDTSRLVLDLLRRGYRVFIRNEDQAHNYVQLGIRDGVLHLDHQHPGAPSDTPDWCIQLERHLELLDARLFNARNTNEVLIPIQLSITPTEEPCQTP